jgi:hypothetical protein
MQKTFYKIPKKAHKRCKKLGRLKKLLQLKPVHDFTYYYLVQGSAAIHARQLSDACICASADVVESHLE